MLIKFPTGYLEVTPNDDDVLVIAVPRNLAATGVTTSPHETHAAFIARGSDDDRTLKRYRSFLKKYKVESTTDTRLFLATAAFLSPTDDIKVSEVRTQIAEAGVRPLPSISATLSYALRRGLCRRVKRGSFAVTDAGRKFIGLPKSSTRNTQKKTT
jgi:hypothetical protein